MPLFINEKPVKYQQALIETLIDDSKWQQHELASFDQSVSAIDDNLSASTLIVIQGEAASIQSHKFECIGTCYATTCHMLFFLNKARQKVMCAHLDEGVNKKQFQDMFKLFTKQELQKEGLSLYIIGGYLDEKRKSIAVTDAVLSLLANEKKFKNYLISLQLLFTSSLNTKYKVVHNEKNEESKVAIPKYQNIGYNLKQQRFCTFEIESEQIPYFTLRSARIFEESKSSTLRVIYDGSNKKYVQTGPRIEAFKWRCPDWIYNVLSSQTFSDERLLQTFSTSPHAEYAGFAADSRALFQLIATKEAEDVFKKGKEPIYLERGIVISQKQQQDKKPKEETEENKKANSDQHENDDNYADEEKSSK